MSVRRAKQTFWQKHAATFAAAAMAIIMLGSQLAVFLICWFVR